MKTRGCRHNAGAPCLVKQGNLWVRVRSACSMLPRGTQHFIARDEGHRVYYTFGDDAGSGSGTIMVATDRARPPDR